MELIEIWKPIEGYENYYQVSNFGRVRRLDYYVNTSINNVKKKLFKGRILKNHKSVGYPSVNLCKDGQSKRFFIHRLVATAFLPNPNNYPVVNHKDENKTNNIVWVNEDGSIDLEKSNLEWCTQKHNMNWNGVMKRVGETLRKSDEEKRENRKIYIETHKKEIAERAHNWYLENYQMKGREMTEVLQYSKDGILIASFESVEEAKRVTGISHIGCACNGKRKSAGGYLWQWGDKKLVYRRIND